MARLFFKEGLVRSFSTPSSSAPPPIRVAFTPDAGRGVFATRNISEGETIHTAEPLITHASLQNGSKVCYWCLKWLLRNDYLDNARNHHLMKGSTYRDGPQESFCSKACSDSAKVLYAVEKKVTWDSFHQFCSENGLRLPLLAKRLICMVLSGMVSRDVLDILSYARPSENTALCWMHTRTMLLDALRGSGVPEEKLSFVSADWYKGVMARISLNSFRVELLQAQSTPNFLAAAVASVSGDAVTGTAVYLLPSMYNHDCDPNVDVTWPTDSNARLSARRDIEEGEELRITYIDASMSRPSRQQLLKEAYHFMCNCARCVDEEYD